LLDGGRNGDGGSDAGGAAGASGGAGDFSSGSGGLVGTGGGVAIVPDGSAAGGSGSETDAGTGAGGATDGAADGAADAAPQDAASSDAASSDAGGFEPDFVTSCLAGLEVKSSGDAVHVEGKAGSVGDVNYTIWGYSGGSYAGSGFTLVANSEYGQVGTPPGIQLSGVGFSVPDGAVQTGVTYRANSLLSGSGPYIEVRIFPAASTPFTNCDQDGSGMMLFTRYEGIRPEHPVVGVYEYHCVSASVAVRGCFRFSGT
jgi:hypothetical protein